MTIKMPNADSVHEFQWEREKKLDIKQKLSVTAVNAIEIAQSF